MTRLTVPDQGLTLDALETVQAYLRARGIFFDRWQADRPLAEPATPEEILAAYRHVLDPYRAAHGYRTADVVTITTQTPNLGEIREKFLKEHTHSEDEVRFFVAGQGDFWFNLERNKQGEAEPVLCVTCGAGDILSVPVGVKHWFDCGERPDVKVIRIFTDAGGWVPHYTGSGVESRYRKASPTACQP